MIWRARDAYRAQNLLGGLAVGWVLLDLWTQGSLYPWYTAIALVALHAALVMGAVVAVRWGMHWLSRTLAAAWQRWLTRRRHRHHGSPPLLVPTRSPAGAPALE
jgi:hypothetical protein